MPDQVTENSLRVNTDTQTIQRLLMSYEEYRNLKQRGDHIFTIQRNGQVLVYYGTRDHSFEPSDPMYSSIQSAWQNFLSQTAGKKKANHFL